MLKLLKSLSPVASLSLKDLSLKLVMPLSLVTSQRTQNFHLLELMSKSDSNFVFTFNKPLKQSNPRTPVKPLVLKACFHDERLCVFATLNEYLQRTRTPCSWFSTVNQPSETT